MTLRQRKLLGFVPDVGDNGENGSGHVAVSVRSLVYSTRRDVAAVIGSIN